MTSTEALLRILDLGERQLADGNVHDARQAIAQLRCKLKERFTDISCSKQNL